DRVNGCAAYLRLAHHLVAGLQISPKSRRLIWPWRPMMMWSCNATPSGAAAFLMSLVTAMSALEGVGSPEGWLWTRISAEAPRSSARLPTSRGINRRMVDRPALLALMLDQHVFAIEKQNMEFLDLIVHDTGIAIIDQLVPGMDDGPLL